MVLLSIRLSLLGAALGRTALIQRRSPAIFSTRQIAQARAACQRKTDPVCAGSETALCRDRAAQPQPGRISECARACPRVSALRESGHDVLVLSLSGLGTFETCRPALKMSANRGIVLKKSFFVDD